MRVVCWLRTVNLLCTSQLPSEGSAGEQTTRAIGSRGNCKPSGHWVSTQNNQLLGFWHTSGNSVLILCPSVQLCGGKALFGGISAGRVG